MLKKWFAPLIALGLAAALSGCFLLPKEAAVPELPLVTPYAGAEYRTVEVTRGDVTLETKLVFAYNPTRKEDLQFAEAGRSYGAIYVTQGDEVKEGQLLAELDTAAEQEAIRGTELELQRLEIRLETARKALEYALEEEKLRGGDSTVTSDARKADIEYYEAAIAIRQKKLAEQQKELDGFRIYAPMDGTVDYLKSVDENSVPSRNETVLRITDNASSIFSVSTSEYALFPVGQTFTVTSGDEEYLCISRDPAQFGFSREPDRNGMVVVCLELAEGKGPEGKVRGEVRIERDKRENVLLLPSRAVFTVGDRSYVYFEDASSGLKTTREVVCGLSDGNWTEILEGLKEGDHVIVN